MDLILQVRYNICDHLRHRLHLQWGNYFKKQYYSYIEYNPGNRMYWTLLICSNFTYTDFVRKTGGLPR